MIFISCLFFLYLCISVSNPQNLLVNIANKGSDIFQEQFIANTSEDVLKLRFQQFDGTLVKHTVDFKSAVQTFHIAILPFREFGETQNQELCFILPVEVGEYISTDAMSKLRQKNPHTVRRPEEDRPTLNLTMDHLLTQSAISLLTHSVQELCSSKKVRAFAQTTDLTRLGLSGEITTNRTIPPNCNDTSSWTEFCLCSYSLCLIWYPCDLKYCKSDPEETEAVEYRCGIKTCHRCFTMTFEARRKIDCLWNVIS